MGATLILPFTFIEVFALIAAFFYNALHANDYERLRIDANNVYFESKFGRKLCNENFPYRIEFDHFFSDPVRKIFITKSMRQMYIVSSANVAI